MKPDSEAFLSCKTQSISGLLSSQSDILSKGSRHLSSGAPKNAFSVVLTTNLTAQSNKFVSKRINSLYNTLINDT